MQNIVVCFSCSMKCLFCLIWRWCLNLKYQDSCSGSDQSLWSVCLMWLQELHISWPERETLLGYPCSPFPVRKSYVQLAITRLRANTCEDSTGSYPSLKFSFPWTICGFGIYITLRMYLCLYQFIIFLSKISVHSLSIHRISSSSAKLCIVWGNVSFWFALSLPHDSLLFLYEKIISLSLCAYSSFPVICLPGRELEHSGCADRNASVPCSSLFLFDPFPVLLHACGGGEEPAPGKMRFQLSSNPN